MSYLFLHTIVELKPAVGTVRSNGNACTVRSNGNASAQGKTHTTAKHDDT
jgi:hypothetical protein